MRDYITVNGWTFEYNTEHNFYECRGRVFYDDEHDEMPDPSLWEATNKLAKELRSEGHNAQATWSEKGWVEVQFLTK